MSSSFSLRFSLRTSKRRQYFGEAPYFAVVVFQLTDGWVKKQDIIANPYTDVPKAKGISVAEWLVKQKIDVVVTKDDLSNKKGPSYVFADAGVEGRISDADNLNTIIEGFRSNH